MQKIASESLAAVKAPGQLPRSDFAPSRSAWRHIQDDKYSRELYLPLNYDDRYR